MRSEDAPISRRSRLDLNEPVEMLIWNAMQAIEKMPPDVKLTEAANKMQEAKNLVADYIDAIIAKNNKV